MLTISVWKMFEDSPKPFIASLEFKKRCRYAKRIQSPWS